MLPLGGSLTPFIHKFRNGDKHYIYDVNTSKILACNQHVWTIIDGYGQMSLEQLQRAYQTTMSAQAVVDACRDILEVQQDGLLQTNPLEQTGMRYSLDYIQRELETKRGQLILNLTEACNLRCKYCVYGGAYPARRTHGGRMMTWEIARRALDEFLAHSIDFALPSITFYGGEPLLNFRLLQQAIEYAEARRSQKELHYGITTNGTLLTDDVGDWLARFQVPITVSLDGPRDIHDAWRTGGDHMGSWTTVIRNLTRLLDRHPEYLTNSRLRFNVVLAPGVDAAEVEEFFVNCAFIPGGTCMNVSGITLDGAAFLDDIPPEQQGIRNIDQLYRKFEDNLIGGIFNGDDCAHPRLAMQRSLFEAPLLKIHKRAQFAGLPRHFMVSSTCIPGVRRLFVTVDGRYYPCERTNDNGSDVQIGDVQNGISSQRAFELFKMFVECNADECKSCWCIRLCTSGCFATVGSIQDSSRQRKTVLCDECRCSTNERLESYCRVMEQNPHAFDYAKNIIFE